jgi:hypothetical protein
MANAFDCRSFVAQTKAADNVRHAATPGLGICVPVKLNPAFLRHRRRGASLVSAGLSAATGTGMGISIKTGDNSR